MQFYFLAKIICDKAIGLNNSHETEISKRSLFLRSQLIFFIRYFNEVVIIYRMGYMNNLIGLFLFFRRIGYWWWTLFCVCASFNYYWYSSNYSQQKQIIFWAVAASLARQITRLSSNLISGRQEDPSEFLLVLLNNLTNCLSLTDLPLDAISLSSPIQHIFGVIMQSSVKCTSFSV